MRQDVIVIGTGIGGSVAAAVLATEGLRVLVLEKNNRTGGVCARYTKRGFMVDLGTHLFSRGGRGPLGALTRRLGAPRIPFVQTSDLAVLRGFGREIPVPREVRRLPAFVARTIRELGLGARDVVDAARFLDEVLRYDDAEIPSLDRLTMWELVTRYTENPRLVGLLGFLLGLYFILPLDAVSAGEGVWCFKRMMRQGGLSYPLGGAVVVPDTFLDAARRRGARVLLRKRVTRIVVESGAVRAVECTDGSAYEAAIVVCTAGLSDLVDLVGESELPPPYVERVRSLRSSMVAVQAKIALRRPLLGAGALVGAYGEDVDVGRLGLDDFDRMYEHIRLGRVAPITPIYAPVPTNFDPSLAPEGAQLITACAVAPTTNIPLADPPSRWTDRMMSALRRLIPGLDDELIWIDTFTTRSIERWIGKSRAPAVSTGQTPGQVGNRRPPVHTPIRGLFACGCGAGARGIGTELAAASGEETADRIVQERTNGLL